MSESERAGPLLLTIVMLAVLVLAATYIAYHAGYSDGKVYGELHQPPQVTEPYWQIEFVRPGDQYPSPLVTIGRTLQDAIANAREQYPVGQTP